MRLISSLLQVSFKISSMNASFVFIKERFQTKISGTFYINVQILIFNNDTHIIGHIHVLDCILFTFKSGLFFHKNVFDPIMIISIRCVEMLYNYIHILKNYKTKIIRTTLSSKNVIITAFKPIYVKRTSLDASCREGSHDSHDFRSQ